MSWQRTKIMYLAILTDRISRLLTPVKEHWKFTMTRYVNYNVTTCWLNVNN